MRNRKSKKIKLIFAAIILIIIGRLFVYSRPVLFSRLLTAEPKITILNPSSSLDGKDIWTVRFQTEGKADLIISSPNATWEELFEDDQKSEDEMRFLDLVCGEQSFKDQLSVVGTNGETRRLTELSFSDSFKPVKFVIADYQCEEESSMSNLMNVSGYPTLEFEFGSAVEYAYDSFSYDCEPAGTCACGSTCGPGSEDYWCNGADNCTTGTCPSLPHTSSENFCNTSTADYSCVCSSEVCSGSCTCQASGSCIYTCDPGWADNDGNPANGCEAELTDNYIRFNNIRMNLIRVDFQ